MDRRAETASPARRRSIGRGLDVARIRLFKEADVQQANGRGATGLSFQDALEPVGLGAPALPERDYSPLKLVIRRGKHRSLEKPDLLVDEQAHARLSYRKLVRHALHKDAYHLGGNDRSSPARASSGARLVICQRLRNYRELVPPAKRG